ncbi:carboxypeptidase-like regulatory domain-containing protein [Marivirga arenosa]|uniref:Carboxypeptidase-like regulatory domain-containing protein n=1 Tax=Marivirga arenosa TaxID=3059076 RepID=A0AA49GIN6_9BACT|nr:MULTISPECIES: carboxypeptidase-like regulatory domain-containing protein [unclassified Marivirga]WKK85916.1 carboxypeptidase-like regulatory domain-containing protein [Marivirga sp. ABR2-2]WNB17688.1 carboxypeptidase-like regulatory domain-containing protein [Marivirga sp. BKB1-2]
MSLKKSILLLLIVFVPFFGFSQEEEKSDKVIQFTGVVLDQDSVSIPGVHIYTPVYGRGTSTNEYGFFSMPALEGDSLVISAVGFKKATYVVPEIKTSTLRVVFQLEQDTEMLNEVQVYNMPPTAEAFKKAVLAVRLPSEYSNINKNLDPATLQEMYKTLPADGSMNHRWFVQQQAFYDQTKNSVRINPLLNPMSWVEIFRAIKNGDFTNND